MSLKYFSFCLLFIVLFSNSESFSVVHIIVKRFDTLWHPSGTVNGTTNIADQPKNVSSYDRRNVTNGFMNVAWFHSKNDTNKAVNDTNKAVNVTDGPQNVTLFDSKIITDGYKNFTDGLFKPILIDNKTNGINSAGNITTSIKNVTSDISAIASEENAKLPVTIPVRTLGRDPIRVIDIAVGEPPKPFTVRLDMDFSDFWLIAEDAELNKTAVPVGVNSTQEEMNLLEKKHRYPVSESHVITEEEIVFQPGCGCSKTSQMNGTVVNDTIQIGNVKFDGAVFGAVRRFNTRYLESEVFQLPIDGHLGAALAPRAGKGSVTIASPVAQYMNTGNTPIVTFYQKSTKFAIGEPSMDGALTIGGLDEANCGGTSDQYRWLKYTTDKHNMSRPEVRMRGLKLADGFDPGFEERDAVFVEGLGLHLPGIVVARIAEHLEAVPTNLGYRLDCARQYDNPIALQMELGDGEARTWMTFNITEYIIKDDKHCQLLLYGHGDEASGQWNYSEDDTRPRPVQIGIGMLQGQCLAIDFGKEMVGLARETRSK